MSNLPEFKDIELSDKEWADPLLAVSDYRATEYCFTSLYIWARFFGTRIARWKDWLLIRSDGEEGCANYIFPAGSGDIAEVLDTMEEDAARIGRRPVLWTVADVKARLEEMFPGRYEFSPVRRSFDYLYETEKMVSLTGKKYQPKRNFISRFKAQNPGWTYESIRPDGDPELCRRQLEECTQAQFHLPVQGAEPRLDLREHPPGRRSGALPPPDRGMQDNDRRVVRP